MKAKEAIIMTDTTIMMPRSKIHGRCPKTIRKEDGTSTKVRPRQLITTTKAASNLNLKTTKKASKKQVLLRIKRKTKTRHLRSKKEPRLVNLRPADNNSSTRSTRHSLLWSLSRSRTRAHKCSLSMPIPAVSQKTWFKRRAIQLILVRSSPSSVQRADKPSLLPILAGSISLISTPKRKDFTLRGRESFPWNGPRSILSSSHARN